MNHFLIKKILAKAIIETKSSTFEDLEYYIELNGGVIVLSKGEIIQIDVKQEGLVWIFLNKDEQELCGYNLDDEHDKAYAFRICNIKKNKFYLNNLRSLSISKLSEECPSISSPRK